jgi:hypothetical protein
MYADRIECGDWVIPATAIRHAVLYRGRQFFIPVSVLEVRAGDTTYQFGFNPWVDVEPNLPFPVQAQDVTFRYSPFSLVVRFLLLILVLWYVWQ